MAALHAEETVEQKQKQQVQHAVYAQVLQVATKMRNYCSSSSSSSSSSKRSRAGGDSLLTHATCSGLSSYDLPQQRDKQQKETLLMLQQEAGAAAAATAAAASVAAAAEAAAAAGARDGLLACCCSCFVAVSVSKYIIKQQQNIKEDKEKQIQ